MSAFKLLTFLFPFLKEMVLGDKTVREAVKTNKPRVFMLALTCFVFFGFIFLVPKVIRISAEYVILEKKYDDLEEQCNKMHCNPASAPPAPAKPEKKEVHHPEAPPPVVVQPPPPAPVQNDPVPQNDPPQPPVADQVPEAPRQPDARRQHHSRPRSSSPPPPLEGMTKTEQQRYDEWRKTFDEIQAREEHNTWTQHNSNYERH